MVKINYTIEPIFKIEFFKITSVKFKEKKEHLEKILQQYPEIPFDNFYSNRNKANFTWELKEIFREEFQLIQARFNTKINLTRAWSVSYEKGQFHVPHNHSSRGYTGIIYLDLKKDSPKTIYIQPWNNEKDQSVLYSPDVKEGQIMIVPQSVMHFTKPNKINFKKRIISFDFDLN